MSIDYKWYVSINTAVPHPQVGRLGIWCATPRGHRRLTQSPTTWGEVSMALTRRPGHYWQTTRCTNASAPAMEGSTSPFLSNDYSPRATFSSVTMCRAAGEVPARMDTDFHPAGHHGRTLTAAQVGNRQPSPSAGRWARVDTKLPPRSPRPRADRTAARVVN